MECCSLTVCVFDFSCVGVALPPTNITRSTDFFAWAGLRTVTSFPPSIPFNQQHQVIVGEKRFLTKLTLHKVFCDECEGRNSSGNLETTGHGRVHQDRRLRAGKETRLTLGVFMLEAPKSDPLSGLSSSGKKESRRERDRFFHPAPPTSISRSGRKKWGDRARRDAFCSCTISGS